MMNLLCKIYTNYSLPSGSHSLSHKKVSGLPEFTYFMFMSVLAAGMCM